MTLKEGEEGIKMWMSRWVRKISGSALENTTTFGGTDVLFKSARKS